MLIENGKEDFIRLYCIKGQDFNREERLNCKRKIQSRTLNSLCYREG